MTITASTGLISSAGLMLGFPEPPSTVRQLAALREAGFDSVDLSDLWRPIAELDDDGVAELRDALDETGLRAVGASIIDVQLHRPERAEEAVARVIAGLERARRLGVQWLSIGFHDGPSPTRVPGPSPSWISARPFPGLDPDGVRAAAAALRRIGEAVEDAGLRLTLEMHASTPLSTARGCLALIEETGLDTIDVNPDLGNLIRAPWRLEENWYQTILALAGRISYWHVKNLHRIELPDETAIAVPAELGAGTIDYRTALRLATAHGFDSPIVVEHYGGDALAVAGRAAAYLRDLERDGWI